MAVIWIGQFGIKTMFDEFNDLISAIGLFKGEKYNGQVTSKCYFGERSAGLGRNLDR